MPRLDRDFSDEVQSHLQMLTDEFAARGLSPADAHRAAALRLGALPQLREAYRDRRGLPVLDQLAADVRYALRLFRKNPGFTIAAAVTLALGIGANTAIFTVVDALLIRSLPVDAPDSLVTIGDPLRVGAWSNGTPRTDVFSYPLYQEVRDHSVVFSSVLASARLDDAAMEIDGAPEPVAGRLVTSNYFETLGVRPALGRLFAAGDDTAPGADPFLVISYDYWQRRFGGNAAIVGRLIRLKHVPLTIIGVAPPGFFGEVVGARADVWAPMMMEPALMPGRDFLKTPDISALQVMARLKPGVTLAQARANVNAVAQHALTESLAALMTSDDRSAMRSGDLRPVLMAPGGGGLSRLRGQFFTALLLLMAMVGVVLLVACINVANLFLSRSRGRQREIALRLAIGARGGRIVRQLLTESVLLALIGGALGLLVADWGSAALVRWAAGRAATPLALGFDWRILTFTAAVCLIAGIAFGLAPAVRCARVPLTSVLNEAERGGSGARQRSGRALITAQIALGVVLLITASLFVRSLRNLQDADLGYQRNALLLARVDLTGSGYVGPAAEAITQDLMGRLSGLPGVRGVTASSNGLFSGGDSSDAARIVGFTPARGSDTVISDDEVGANYFSTIGVPIVVGRDISDRDIRSRARVAVVNESFAHFYFAGRDPIGGRIFIEDSDHPNAPAYEIVGVARDVHDHAVQGGVPHRMYAPLTTASFDYPGSLDFEIRTDGAPEALVASVRAALRQQDPRLVVKNVDTATDLVMSTLSSPALVADLSFCFGALVIVLISVGLYGTMSYSVTARTREIGLRMALGAPRSDLVWMVARDAGVMLLAGAAVGVPASVAVAELLKSLLFGVGALDPGSILVGVGTIVVVAVAATAIPVRRATHVDPVIALRAE